MNSLNEHKTLYTHILSNNGIIDMRKIEFKDKLLAIGARIESLDLFYSKGYYTDKTYSNKIDELVVEMIQLQEDYEKPLMNTPKLPTIEGIKLELGLN